MIEYRILRTFKTRPLEHKEMILIAFKLAMVVELYNEDDAEKLWASAREDLRANIIFPMDKIPVIEMAMNNFINWRLRVANGQINTSILSSMNVEQRLFVVEDSELDFVTLASCDESEIDAFNFADILISRARSKV